MAIQESVLSLKQEPIPAKVVGWRQGWSDEVIEQAVQAYEETASSEEARLQLYEAGYVDAEGNPPSSRTIRRWVERESKARNLDIRQGAIQQQRDDIRAMAWASSKDAIMKARLAKNGQDTFGYAGAAKTFFDIGERVAAQREGTVFEEFFALMGRRVTSHANLEYVDGKYKELPAGE